MPVPNILGITPPVKAENWSIMTLGPGPLPARYDLCQDCTEVLVEQFMVGANVHAITQPPGQNILPHDNVPYQDCLLAFDPEVGGFVCEHDDPERFLKLQRDRAQNVAEGVPEQAVDKTNWVRCKDCDCTSAESVACQCSCHPVKTVQEWGLEKTRQVQARIGQLASDMHTAGWAHSIVQSCSAACSEQHTYGEHCILEGVVQAPGKSEPVGQIMPPACGAECGETAPDGSMPNPHHTYNFGTCLMNKDTARAVLVVCPVCKEEGSMSGLVSHMAEQHQMSPDYVNAQWVDARGYNLDGRLISQQGEDLTEAYSEQEAAE